MIKIVEGNLLLAKENIIGHSVNCKGKMNSGIAKQIKECYPEVYKQYIDYIDDTKMSMSGQEFSSDILLGTCQLVFLNTDIYDNKRYVSNLFGQDSFGYDGKQYTDNESLYKALKKLRACAELNNLSVALPYGLGSYRGGSDWKEVEGLILKAFDGYEVTLYKYHEGL